MKTPHVILLMLLVANAGAYVTFKLGQYAYRPVRRIADETGQNWLDTHMERTGSGIYVF